MAEHWVTVFHLIKSSGRPVQMLHGLHLKGVLTFGEWERPPANLTLGSGDWFAFLRPVAWHDYASHFTILSTVEYRASNSATFLTHFLLIARALGGQVLQNLASLFLSPSLSVSLSLSLSASLRRDLRTAWKDGRTIVALRADYYSGPLLLWDPPLSESGAAVSHKWLDIHQISTNSNSHLGSSL